MNTKLESNESNTIKTLDHEQIKELATKAFIINSDRLFDLFDLVRYIAEEIKLDPKEEINILPIQRCLDDLESAGLIDSYETMSNKTFYLSRFKLAPNVQA